MKFTNRLITLFILIALALGLRFGILRYLDDHYPAWLRLVIVVVILGVGAVFVLRGTAKIIEETTDVLQERTKLSGGLLQSLGTAFPDMVLGVTAALISLRLQSSDYARAIDYAIIAAATTFGSNIYNIGHAAWCVWRQNLANRAGKSIIMFPGIAAGGSVTPMAQHTTKPTIAEFDTATKVLVALTILTAVVALSMVAFGQVQHPPANITGSLYQLIKPVGLVVLLAAIGVLYYFRKTKRADSPLPEVYAAEEYYRTKPTLTIWLHLGLAGAAILMAAESMVHAIETFSHLTHVPFVIAGVLAGIIGCLGEMIVVHNFSVHPKGRIGDAIMGVAMDNIVTIMGAAIVAVMGGIFLGSNALIIIFVIIFTLNTVLMQQISILKNFYLTDK